MVFMLVYYKALSAKNAKERQKNVNHLVHFWRLLAYLPAFSLEEDGQAYFVWRIQF